MEEVKQRRCCGLDVHKKTVFACVLSTQGNKPVHKVFGTFRNDLIRMRVWLKQMSVTDVAMESTGVYWRPVWNVLDGHGLVLLLAIRDRSKRCKDARATSAIRGGLPSFCTMGGWMEALCRRVRFVI